MVTSSKNGRCLPEGSVFFRSVLKETSNLFVQFCHWFGGNGGCSQSGSKYMRHNLVFLCVYVSRQTERGRQTKRRPDIALRVPALRTRTTTKAGAASAAKQYITEYSMSEPSATPSALLWRRVHSKRGQITEYPNVGLPWPTNFGILAPTPRCKPGPSSISYYRPYWQYSRSGPWKLLPSLFFCLPYMLVGKLPTRQ